jgi:SAM-dependent methyltransferase
MVSLRPSSSGTIGFQLRSACARLMSGQRRVGSSDGNGLKVSFERLSVKRSTVRRRLKRAVFRSPPNSRPPSNASSQKPTQIPKPSSGPPIPNGSSPLSNAGSKRFVSFHFAASSIAKNRRTLATICLLRWLGVVVHYCWMENRTHRGFILPPEELTPCGRLTDTEEKFFTTSCEDARLISDVIALTYQSHILDIGCGVGRFPIGLRAIGAPFKSYLGVDVSKERVDWCAENLTTQDARLAFQFMDMANERYNPAGKGSLDLDIAPQSVDVIYLYSVFSHLREADVRAYLNMFERVLTAKGTCFLTMFVADGVAPVSVNPEGFGPLKWAGPLHCVLYARDHWSKMVEESGLRVSRQIENVNIDGQTAYYLQRC